MERRGAECGTGSSKAGYRRSVDLARFVAAFGIVWDHARAPYADIGYTALALFLVLTSFLAVGSFERSDGKRFWLSRAQRIALAVAVLVRVLLGGLSGRIG